MNTYLMETISLSIYLLCAITALVCAVLLLRSYKASHKRLLLWSGLCFVGLFLNALLIVVDVRIVPDTDLSGWRSLPSLLGISFLIYGMVMESE